MREGNQKYLIQKFQEY